MEKETIIFYLKYAMNYGKSVKIQTRNNKFIITPFRLQADILREQYGKERCGTIHTFQGKREKQVYFSAVLNNTKECINHLNGQNNLFSKQLINVAVSRAKDKFVLVADKEFFKKNDENMRNLIENGYLTEEEANNILKQAQ